MVTHTATHRETGCVDALRVDAGDFFEFVNHCVRELDVVVVGAAGTDVPAVTHSTRFAGAVRVKCDYAFGVSLGLIRRTSEFAIAGTANRVVVNNERYGLVALVGIRNVHNKGALLAIDGHGHVLLISDLCCLAGAVNSHSCLSVVAAGCRSYARRALLARIAARCDGGAAGASNDAGTASAKGIIEGNVIARTRRGDIAAAGASSSCSLQDNPDIGFDFGCHLVVEVFKACLREHEHGQRIAFLQQSPFRGQLIGAALAVGRYAQERGFLPRVLAHIDGEAPLDIAIFFVVSHLAKNINKGNCKGMCVQPFHAEDVARIIDRLLLSRECLYGVKCAIIIMDNGKTTCSIGLCS